MLNVCQRENDKKTMEIYTKLIKYLTVKNTKNILRRIMNVKWTESFANMI